ncbi:uncharacterized protein LOC135120353 [Zophobas morio]|uniref:uncharacterized protein LOC135120353 n=1 Tax=Zophobas morio TaxID=2755281 RepID=UPI003082783D
MESSVSTIDSISLKPVKWFTEFKKTLSSQEDKVIAITGTTTGLGLFSAKNAAELGATVILLNRPSSRSISSYESLKASVPQGNFQSIDCDLKSFESVKKAAAYILENFSRLDVLANNAAVMAQGNILTEDGFDIQMQTNYLSHFLLTKLLYPLLVKTAKSAGESRIINHTSVARFGTSLNPKYLQKQNCEENSSSFPLEYLGRWERYHQSKLANALFTYALKERIKNVNVKALLCHPGVASTSLQSNHAKSGYSFNFSSFMVKYFGQSLEDGSIGLLHCICGNGEKIQSGDFYGPGWSPFAWWGPLTRISPGKAIIDEKQCELLWKESELAIGEPFLLE